jgi:rhodanese-related sulfurtransferase
MVLNAAEPDADLAALVDATLSQIPQGWGVVTAEQLNAEIVENPDLIVIDVRTQAEVDENGVIDAPNLISIPLEELVQQRAEWPADTALPIVVYCGSGHRSTMAMTILWTYGYSDVRSLKGGFGEWAAAGYPVVELEALTS